MTSLHTLRIRLWNAIGRLAAIESRRPYNPVTGPARERRLTARLNTIRFRWDEVVVRQGRS